MIVQKKTSLRWWKSEKRLNYYIGRSTFRSSMLWPYLSMWKKVTSKFHLFWSKWEWAMNVRKAGYNMFNAILSQMNAQVLEERIDPLSSITPLQVSRSPGLYLFFFLKLSFLTYLWYRAQWKAGECTRIYKKISKRKRVESGVLWAKRIFF